jgi:hypothetical protein
MSRHAPFILEWNLSNLGDEEYFAYLVEFPGYKDIVRLARTEPYKLPKRLFFTSNFYKLKELDYPYNNVRWPLMSPRMLAVLNQVGSFAYSEVSVIMLDDTIPESELFLNSGEYNPKYTYKQFVGIQLLSHLDAFDWESSVYERSEHIKTLIVDISKLALIEPPSGFPPIFRLSACPTLLFVSAEARLALEDANISGVAFRAINDYPYGKF